MAIAPRGRADYLDLGNWNVVCFQCGRKFKAFEMRKHWQGYWVCPEHWEPREAQDFVKGVPDNPTPPWVQPEPADTFAPFCTPDDASAIPWRAIPGCLTPARLPYDWPPTCTIAGGAAIPDVAIPNCVTPDLIPGGYQSSTKTY